jgi:hypothetical protein
MKDLIPVLKKNYGLEKFGLRIGRRYFLHL